jgi:DNA-binding transcriptional ArsR family regulator
MALGMSISVARGEPVLDYFKSSKAAVLYFALEDSYRRLQQRISLILKNKTDKTIPENLFFQCEDQEVPKLNEGGIVELELLLDEYTQIKFVIFDTFGRCRADQGRRDGNIYLGDYEILAGLQQLALKKRVCILLIHHTRKLAAENVFDELSGTTGITGAVDSIFVLKKVRGDYKLFVTGRDLPEAEYKLKFDENNFEWGIQEEVKDGKKLAAEREEIVQLLKDYGRPMKLSEIEEILDKSKSNLSKLLKKLIEDKIVISKKYGYFQLIEEIKSEDDNDDAMEVLPF